MFPSQPSGPRCCLRSGAQRAAAAPPKPFSTKEPAPVPAQAQHARCSRLPQPSLPPLPVTAGFLQQAGPVLRVLDLYSGIGGMHAALRRVVHQDSKVTVAAMDVDSTANAVYTALHGVTPQATDLTRATPQQLDALAADLWLITPPCQPYTTTANARRRDATDPRAASLMHLLTAVLPRMRCPPRGLLLENVCGFVGSDAHAALHAALAAAGAGGYCVQEFLVSPHQLGVPYSRPRYFALALQRPLQFAAPAGMYSGLTPHPPCVPGATAAGDRSASWAGPAMGSAVDAVAGVGRPTPTGSCDASGAPVARCCAGARGPEWPPVHAAGPDAPCAPLAAYLLSVAPSSSPNADQDGAAAAAAMSCSSSGGAGSSGSGVDDDGVWLQHGIPLATLARYWRVLDVVTPSCTYSTCFTSSYSRNTLAAGSVLASAAFAAAHCARDDRGRLHFAQLPAVSIAARRRQRQHLQHPRQQRMHAAPSLEGDEECVVVGLRYFAPGEVAAIHGLVPRPEAWSERVAAGVSLRRQYGLLGNGLSVDVAAHLLRYLLSAVQGCVCTGEGIAK